MNAPLVSVVIPVYNEEQTLVANVRKVLGYLAANCRHPFELTIAENGSNDRTGSIALKLQKEYEAVNVLSLPQKGRGRAVKEAWLRTEAEFLVYMDVDLSTDLSSFPALIQAMRDGGHDLAIGNRFAPTSSRKRSLKREILSGGYNLLVKSILKAHFSDAQCGFKGITRRAPRELLPLVRDDYWFMDTELLILAEHFGYSIAEIPVYWVDDPDSRVEIWSTVWQDIKGLLRLRREIRQMTPPTRRSPGCTADPN